MQVHDLVPYLKDTNGQHHNFGHTIHTIEFESDDEYDIRKKDISAELKKRLNIEGDPLVGVVASVYPSHYLCISLFPYSLFRLPKHSICSSTF